MDAQECTGRRFGDLVRGGLEGAVQPGADEFGHAADEQQAADLVLVRAAVGRAEEFARLDRRLVSEVAEQFGTALPQLRYGDRLHDGDPTLARVVHQQVHERPHRGAYPCRRVVAGGLGGGSAGRLESQKQRYLRRLLRADDLWCQLFGEPAAGSDLAPLRTSAVRAADGAWRVNGQKVWTTLAHLADYGILLAGPIRTCPSTAA